MFLIVFCGGAVAASEEKAMLVSEPVYECQDPDYQSFLQKNYILFEVGQVHPLESSADGKWVFALNSPLGCLEIYRVENNRLQLASSVAVGIQPVSARVRNSHEVWVVNHLSDNVSVVELSGRPRIKQILQVGDAPFDVAFAARDASGEATRAYISMSARGQHHPTFALPDLLGNVLEYQDAGQLKQEKRGMADLWVYDVRADARFEGIINPFMSDLRTLAVSEDSQTVYAAGFLSGNRTTSISSEPQTVLSGENIGSAASSRIVQKQGERWIDSEGADKTDQVSIDLPDIDVIAVDATRAPLPFRVLNGKPTTNSNRQLIKSTYSGMGTVLFSLAVDKDALLLSALDSNNNIALEENLAGRATSNVLVVQRKKQGAERMSLDALATKNTQAPRSIPLPGAIHVGKHYIYVAGYGSARVGVFRRISQGNALPALVGIMDLSQQFGETPASLAGVQLAGMGPSGIVELPSGDVVVLSRLDNTLRLLRPDAANAGHFTLLQTLAMFTPEPENIVQGRRFLYDADKTGNGKMACASCHIFGDRDGLAWDIGSRFDRLVENDKPFIKTQGAMIQDMANTVRRLPLTLLPSAYEEGSVVPVGRYELPLCFKGSADALHEKLRSQAFGKRPCALYVTQAAGTDSARDYHYAALGEGNQWLSVNFPHFNALKGPMTTHTLFGLAYGGPMHHRGDRTGSAPKAGNHCPEGESLEDRAFKEFNQPCDGGNGAFVTLLSGHRLEAAEMAAFSEFALRMRFPPNPHRAFDNNIPADWAKLFSVIPIAKDITSTKALQSESQPGIMSCTHCHKLDVSEGHFGTSGYRYYSAPSVITQDTDVPDFRGFYRKLGLYNRDYMEYVGMPVNTPLTVASNIQVSGFGYFHDGTIDAINAVFNTIFMRFPGDRLNEKNGDVEYDIENRKNLFYYLSLFDTDVFPVSGQQRFAYDRNSRHVVQDIRYCNTYAFVDGVFKIGFMPNLEDKAMLTCYPRLQAKK